MFLSKLIPVEDAKKIIINCLKASPTERINLDKAYQRVNANEVVSALDSPPFDRSAMDGYAVQAEYTFGHSEKNPVQLKIVDHIGAGEESKLKLQKFDAPLYLPMPMLW
jgi:molybdopterin molybdotransferase